MSTVWDRLTEKLRELTDLYSALALLQWDQKAVMPDGGAPARARAIATLEGMAHELFTRPEMGELIEELHHDDGLSPDRQACVRILKRDYDRATKLPGDLVRALAEQTGQTYQAWTEARPASDFGLLEPSLTELVRLKKEEVDILGYPNERYDALIDLFEPGVTAGELEAMFEELLEGLRPIAEARLERAGEKPDFLSVAYETEAQDKICRWIVDVCGFDLSRGRLDTSPHPFTVGIAPGDVRQTVRYVERRFLSSVYAAIHETGHALYEQGIPDEFAGLPIGRVPSFGMHESQSRLWENHVGRGRAFTDFMLPNLKDHLPGLGNVSPDDFYRGVNHAERSAIRVEADELTYNLHIALRFELELAQFRDELEVRDLPEAWDSMMEKYLGIRPENQHDGVLQDMHWATGMHGYFPSYTLGTVYAAALYDKADDDIGGLDDPLRAGDTAPLREWLSAHVYSQGYRYETKDLMQRIVGEDVGVGPLLNHLDAKYEELYP